MRYVKDKFGHRIQVTSWPSGSGTETLRKHYKRVHPTSKFATAGGAKKRARKAARGGVTPGVRGSYIYLPEEDRYMRRSSLRRRARR